MEQGEDMDRIIILLSQSAEAKKKPLSYIEKGEMFYVSFRVFWLSPLEKRDAPGQICSPSVPVQTRGNSN